jgi:hypothetical protein
VGDGVDAEGDGLLFDAGVAEASDWDTTDVGFAVICQ